VATRSSRLLSKPQGCGLKFFIRRGGDNPLGFVISLNVKRRHLEPGQLAGVAANIANMSHGGARRSDQAATSPHEISQADAAALGDLITTPDLRCRRTGTPQVRYGLP
jgi:hypothetical protein